MDNSVLIFRSRILPLFLVLQCIVLLFQLMVFGKTMNAHRQSPYNNTTSSEIKANSISVTNKQGDDVIRMYSSPVEYTDNSGKKKLGDAATVELWLGEKVEPSMKLQTAPLHGPQLVMNHHLSSSQISLNAIHKNEFCLSFFSVDERRLTCRIIVDMSDNTLKVLDDSDKPIIIIDTSSGRDKAITVMTNKAVPFNVERPH